MNNEQKRAREILNELLETPNLFEVRKVELMNLAKALEDVSESICGEIARVLILHSDENAVNYVPERFMGMAQFCDDFPKVKDLLKQHVGDQEYLKTFLKDKEEDAETRFELFMYFSVVSFWPSAKRTEDRYAFRLKDFLLPVFNSILEDDDESFDFRLRLAQHLLPARVPRLLETKEQNKTKVLKGMSTEILRGSIKNPESIKSLVLAYKDPIAIGKTYIQLLEGLFDDMSEEEKKEAKQCIALVHGLIEEVSFPREI